MVLPFAILEGGQVEDTRLLRDEKCIEKYGLEN
jgi:hypothetical protein